MFQLNKISLHKIDGEENIEELITHDAEYFKELDENATTYQITILEEKLRSMKPNMSAIPEYKRKVSLFFVHSTQNI